VRRIHFQYLRFPFHVDGRSLLHQMLQGALQFSDPAFHVHPLCPYFLLLLVVTAPAPSNAGVKKVSQGIEIRAETLKPDRLGIKVVFSFESRNFRAFASVFAT
jgi:hypothetical protein